MEHLRMGMTGLRLPRIVVSQRMITGSDQTQISEALDSYRHAGGSTVQLCTDTWKRWENLPRQVVDMECVLQTSAASDSSRAALLRSIGPALAALPTKADPLLWLVRGWDEHTSAAEIAECLVDVRRRGLVGYVGISGMPAWFAALIAEKVAASGAPLAVLGFPSGLLTYQDDVRQLSRAVNAGCWGYGLETERRALHSPEMPPTWVDALSVAGEGLELTPMQMGVAWMLLRVDVLLAQVYTPAGVKQILAASEAQVPPSVKSALDDVIFG